MDDVKEQNTYFNAMRLITNHTNPEFLIKQMEYQEKIEDHSHDKCELVSIQKELQEELEQYRVNLETNFNKKILSEHQKQINEFILLINYI